MPQRCSDDITEHFATRVHETSERVSWGMTNPIAHDTIKQHNVWQLGAKRGSIKNYRQNVLQNNVLLRWAQGTCDSTSRRRAMEYSTSCEADSFSTSQQIPHILRNPNVHCHIHKSRPPVHIPSQINPVHSSDPSYIFKIYLNSILPFTPISSKCSLFRRLSRQDPVYTCPHSPSPIHPARLIFLSRSPE